MIRRSWTEIANSVGTQTYDLTQDLFQSARDFTCGLWNQYPDRMSGNGGVPGAFTRGWMNAACQDNNPPQPPVVNVPGGQCCDKTYEVTVSYQILICFEDQVIETNTQTKTVTGKINGLYLGEYPPNPQGTGLYIEYENCGGSLFYSLVWSTSRQFVTYECTTTSAFEADTSKVSVSESIYTIDSIVTVDGSPDNCGTTPPGYPVSPEPTINDVTEIVTINNYDGTTNNVELSLDIINNNISNSLELPITLIFGGIRMSVNVGGITINNNTSNRTFNSNRDRLPDNTRHPLPLPENPEPPPETRDEPDSPSYGTVVLPASQSRIVELGASVVWVALNLVDIPSNARPQWGVIAPDIYFAGWFEFQSSLLNFRREPIHFKRNVCYPPIGANKFAYTLQTGYTGTVILYVIRN